MNCHRGTKRACQATNSRFEPKSELSCQRSLLWLVSARTSHVFPDFSSCGSGLDVRVIGQAFGQPESVRAIITAAMIENFLKRMQKR